MAKIMNIDHNTENHTGEGAPFLLIIIWSVSGFFHILSMFTMDEIYTWVYRALSFVLLLFGFYLNWPKVVEQYKKRKKKKTKY